MRILVCGDFVICVYPKEGEKKNGFFLCEREEIWTILLEKPLLG